MNKLDPLPYLHLLRDEKVEKVYKIYKVLFYNPLFPPPYVITYSNP